MKKSANIPVRQKFEAPTWCLVLIIYGGWLAMTWFAMAMPVWLLLPVGAWLAAWYYSLQHEVIHGHPSPWRWLNDLIGTMPLNLLIPYPIYRASHTQHHTRDNLTIPGLDPESFYFTAETWASMPALLRFIHVANNTLVGRLTIRPAVAAVMFWIGEIRRIGRGDYSDVPVWLIHILLSVVVLYWVTVVCAIPLWLYILAFAYPGLALTLMRSYIEHQDAVDPEHRTAIVECQTLLGILYLYNNLHVAHHDMPSLAWYRLPAHYAAHREEILQRNGGYLFRGYRNVVRNYLFAPIHHPVLFEAGPPT